MQKHTAAKLFAIIILAIIILTVSSAHTYAIGEIISGADNFVNDGKAEHEDNPATNEEELQNAIDNIYNTLLIVGVAAAVIVGMFLGIQFILGSVEQKSKIKESLIPYVVGCAVIFGAFGIWRLVIIILR